MPSPATGTRLLAAAGGPHAPAASVFAATGSPTPSTTAKSPFVTLVPNGPGGHPASTSEDATDFYGLGAAIIAIVIIVVLAKLVFRQRGPGRGPAQEER